MSQQKVYHCVMVVSLIALFVSQAASAQSNLQITSPATNTSVTPGETITVVVTRSPDIAYVTLVGDLLSGAAEIKTGPDPLTFSVVVPSDKKAGEHRLAALDVTPRPERGNGIMSTPISLEVKPQGTIIGISANPQIVLRYVGDAKIIQAFARTSTGVSMDISASSDLTWTSSNEAIVNVDSRGRVIATGPGAAIVELQYNGFSTSVPVTVPNLVPGDLNGDERVDLDDANILKKALNTPANGPNDARDLNHDGKIDELDVSTLTTLCTYPSCATHP